MLKTLLKQIIKEVAVNHITEIIKEITTPETQDILIVRLKSPQYDACHNIRKAKKTDNLKKCPLLN